jgi:predicted lysophospholipase L1 biosynthesis ABC-type transport system permease subunit
MAEQALGAVLEQGVQRQIALPWRQAFLISMRNVTLRLGRAAVTGTGVVLGIAFLTSVLTGQVIQKGLDDYEKTKARSVAATDIGKAEAEEAQKANLAKGYWLVVMSLLVCGVGITNSLLMSVTERFREIGTMKCLGALDEFIVRLFLIEAGVLGFLGSVTGALVGHLVVLLIGCIKHGFTLPAKMNWVHMLGYLGLSIAVGIILSLFAAFWPAVSAAKMPPAAALRTEI